jgi:hypothetical protein
MNGDWRIFLGSLLLVACERAAPLPVHEAKAIASTQGATESAVESLDRLDLRAAVPLLPMMANHQKQNMREHLIAVQEIIAGLATDDFPVIERAASRMGFSEPMAEMCRHLGAGAPGFSEQALRFHHTADTITSAARKRDPAAVLAALAGTLATCTSCHAAFKQRVVDEQVWQRATSLSAPAPGDRGTQK